MLEEQEASVVDPRGAGTEPPGEAFGLVFGSDVVGDHLPLHPERGVGEQVVESAAGVLVVVEAVPEPDPRRVQSFDQHVGPAGGVGLGVEFLAVDVEAALGVEVAQVLLGHRQHPPGPAGRVQHGLDDPRCGQQVVVVNEQEVDHQADHLAGREVLAGRLVGQFRELADQLLVDVAHLQVRHHLRTHIEIGELRHHQIKKVVLLQPVDLGVEVELDDDVPGRFGEPGDVVAQVAGHVVGIGEQRLERVLGSVVERLACDVFQHRATVFQARREHLGSFQDRFPGGF